MLNNVNIKLSYFCFVQSKRFYKNLLQHMWPSGLSGYHAAFYCAVCWGFKPHMGKYFVGSKNCYSASRCSLSLQHRITNAGVLFLKEEERKIFNFWRLITNDVFMLLNPFS